jgi:hypothetical protein
MLEGQNRDNNNIQNWTYNQDHLNQFVGIPWQALQISGLVYGSNVSYTLKV